MFFSFTFFVCWLPSLVKMDTEEFIKRCRAIWLSEKEERRVYFKSRMKENGVKIVVECLMGE